MNDPVRGGLGCAQCGRCCDPVYLSAGMAAYVESWSPQQLVGVPDPATDEGWESWRAHGWDDDRRADAVARFQPGHPDRETIEFAAEHWHLREAQPEQDREYDCDMYNPQTLLCTAGEGRPPVCRGYPWYGEDPSVRRSLGLAEQCSYLLDVAPSLRPPNARPLIPLEVL
jgi:Fe-S-cluster containining protein